MCADRHAESGKTPPMLAFKFAALVRPVLVGLGWNWLLDSLQE
jgi:hypothetical protein